MPMFVTWNIALRYFCRFSLLSTCTATIPVFLSPSTSSRLRKRTACTFRFPLIGMSLKIVKSLSGLIASSFPSQRRHEPIARKTGTICDVSTIPIIACTEDTLSDRNG